jgi:hypothetical protein
MDCLEVRQLIIIRINADAKKEAGVSTINDLCAALELDEVGLVFLVSWGDEAVDLSI